MKIVKIETFPVFYPLSIPYGDANGLKKYRSCYFIRIYTKSGYSGWGEIVDYLPLLDKGFQERILPYLIGKDALQRSSIVQEISKWHQRSASGVSMALTEIAAQAANLSVCELWGGALRDQIPLYASFQSYRDSDHWIRESVAQVEKAILSGFMRCKVKVGGKKITEDAHHIQTLLAKIDCSIGIILDANQSYDLATAKWWEKLFADYDRFLWFEEPMPLQNVPDYHALRNSLSVAIAAGENLLTSKQFLPFLVQSALDIIQPDVNRQEGIDGFRNSVELARTFGIRCSPHAFDGALSRLYAAFTQACISPWCKMTGDDIEPLEWDMMENPFNEVLPIQPVRGMLTIPKGKGIGVELDQTILEKYRWDGTIY